MTTTPSHLGRGSPAATAIQMAASMRSGSVPLTSTTGSIVMWNGSGSSSTGTLMSTKAQTSTTKAITTAASNSWAREAIAAA